MSADLAERLLRRLDAAFARTDALFAMIPQDALHLRPIGLRHPFLFYLGHLPAFAWNQIGRGVLGEGKLHPTFDVLFERGIDPADEEGARSASVSAWPAVDEVLAYRDEARRAVRPRLGDVLARSGDPLAERGRIVHIVIEHELMHQETLLYMVAQCPAGAILRPVEAALPEGGEGRAAEPRQIVEGVATLGASFEELDFGWDNEFGRVEITVPAFTLDSLPVRNRDWLDFFDARGSPNSLFPESWTRGDRRPSIKTLFGPVPFELAEGWPVQVSGEQARVYCASRRGRLPTEAELHRVSPSMPAQGNLGFRRLYPVPAGSTPAAPTDSGVEELVGNGWEWTATPFAPLPGFVPYARTYPGYSADFFDGEHDVVFGASFATDEALVRPSFRNWYRRSYPHAFTKFRVACDTRAGC